MKDKIDEIRFLESVENWEEAIREVGKSLLEKGCIYDSYIEAMIKNVIDNGAYIVIVPGLAMPHARPECGVIKNGMAILKLETPVMFPDNQSVNLLISFAAIDADEHMKLMSKLADVLMQESTVEKLLNANSEEEILNILQ